MPISFDPANKYILITSPTTNISALEIYSTTMDWCDEQPTISYSVPMKAIGKAPIGGGIYTDSIFILQDGWKIKFWSGTYQAIITGTLITDDESQRTVPPDSGNVEVVFQVTSQGTLTQSEVIDSIDEKTDKISDIDVKTGYIPSNLTDVPTISELESTHGSGSWEGATPTQLWDHSTRALTSRDISLEDHIAKEETLINHLSELAEEMEAIKKAIEEVEIAKPEPKSIAQYLESLINE